MLAILGSKEGLVLPQNACSNRFFIHCLTMNMQKNSITGKDTGKRLKLNFSPQAMGL